MEMEMRRTLDPVFDVLDVLVRVLQVLLHVCAVGVEEVGFRRAAGLHGHGPGAVLDSGRDVALKRILPSICQQSRNESITSATYSLGRGKIHIVGAGGAVECVEGVHRLNFAGIGIHTAGSLARLDVAPDHGCHIPLVVHEAGVEVGRFVGVGRRDVRPTTREGIFQEVEHGEELPGRHDHVVAEPTRDDS